MSHDSNAGFCTLWPTLFLHRNIAGSSDANRHIKKLVLEREKANARLTSDYASYNLFEIDHPVVAWLKQCVNKTVADYLNRQGLGYPVHWNLQGWANVNRNGDYHNVHNHPHSYLSGTYYVVVPSGWPPRAGRDDVNPGAISFFDPRPQANMNAIAGDGQVEAEHRIDPAAGDILLWPAFLHHFVHPNLSDELRISISFNIMLKPSPEQLPT
ncbi:MAG: hypothetical protein DWQ08_02015 [Proteobacteria bacterium]|nr:MAG: hypothetical protein DWQ08_02015 [Pseudomonadota bacterium]